MNPVTLCTSRSARDEKGKGSTVEYLSSNEVVHALQVVPPLSNLPVLSLLSQVGRLDFDTCKARLKILDGFRELLPVTAVNIGEDGGLLR